MQYETIPPPPHLAHLIRFFWVMEGTVGYTHYNMADACVELLFHLDGRFDEIEEDGKISSSFTSGVHGACHTLRRYTIDTGFRIFGVYFYPQAIPLLFSLSAAELANTTAELSYLLKGAGRILEEKVMLAKNNRERCDIICRFTEERLSAGRIIELPVFAAIRDIVHRRSSASIQSLSKAYYLSERQFERQFKQYAGLSPKLYSRIVRFQSATAFYHRREMSLGSLAQECGYYDQSHFISDFKTFSGMHPKQYFSGRSEATVWRD
ncbi:helix-turn-helix transcriptional regulator [Chitinophaga arvensicola]|uniref:Helix-turn-helix domain-containing protein n=1 Tax=Chitinophaga arvensicola TaxID=29529 RepID=A0A1I0RP36_9BACT|nr:helix-turn-helix transcriptional regulator [Chitinophaga arvensicola]SEW43018.1 Helix-turn-helix domain-containing protein [Chitinophaga arvensicola]